MLAQVQSYLRRSASRVRDVEHIGSFLATFSTDSANRYLNYAIPDDGADPLPSDVEALVAAYQQRGRTPRLEYSPCLSPAVEEPLIKRGFTGEGRLLLMVCPPGTLKKARVPAGIELVIPRSDADVAGMLAAQNEAYGDAAPTPAAVKRHREFLAAGGISVLAREIATGEPVGGGMCDVPFAAHEAEARIYERVGFVTIGDMLHISLSSAG